MTPENIEQLSNDFDSRFAPKIGIIRAIKMNAMRVPLAAPEQFWTSFSSSAREVEVVHKEPGLTKKGTMKP